MAIHTEAHRPAEAEPPVTEETVERHALTLLSAHADEAWAEVLAGDRNRLVERLVIELENLVEPPMRPDIETEANWLHWIRTLKSFAASQVDNSIATCRTAAEGF